MLVCYKRDRVITYVFCRYLLPNILCFLVFYKKIKCYCIAITDVEDQEIIHQVLNGNYLVVYGSTECLSTVMEGHLQKRNSFLKC